MGRSIKRRMSGLLLRGGVWHIDKVIHGTRICESTGTSDLEEAEALLMRRLQAARATRFLERARNIRFARPRQSTWKKTNTSAAWNGMRGRWRLWIRTSGSSRCNVFITTLCNTSCGRDSERVSVRARSIAISRSCVES